MEQRTLKSRKWNNVELAGFLGDTRKFRVATLPALDKNDDFAVLLLPHMDGQRTVVEL